MLGTAGTDTGSGGNIPDALHAWVGSANNRRINLWRVPRINVCMGNTVNCGGTNQTMEGQLLSYLWHSCELPLAERYILLTDVNSIIHNDRHSLIFLQKPLGVSCNTKQKQQRKKKQTCNHLMPWPISTWCKCWFPYWLHHVTLTKK